MRYFAVSDIHADYNALILELDKKGFEKHDPNHTLISLGDNFDRGLQSKEVFNFLNSLKRKVLIKGNHELMLRTALERGKLEYLDFYNGMGETFSSFNYFNNYETTSMRSMINWIDNMNWYYETENYIYVHGWVPKPRTSNEYYINLKNVPIDMWEDSIWSITPEEILKHQEQYPNGYNKTIVFGHWGTWLLHNDKNNHNIWKDKEKKLIGLDTTSVISGKVNVLVIEDEPIE